MAGTPITIINQSDTRLLFSVFKAGDAKVPFSKRWIDPNSQGELKVGSFASVGVGVQAQSGGKWIGGTPKEADYLKPGQTLTFVISRTIT